MRFSSRPWKLQCFPAWQLQADSSCYCILFHNPLAERQNSWEHWFIAANLQETRQWEGAQWRAPDTLGRLTRGHSLQIWGCGRRLKSEYFSPKSYLWPLMKTLCCESNFVVTAGLVADYITQTYWPFLCSPLQSLVNESRRPFYVPDVCRLTAICCNQHIGQSVELGHGFWSTPDNCMQPLSFPLTSRLASCKDIFS